MTDMPDQADIQLAAKIIDAIKELDAADSVKKEKAIIAGQLLAEAQKRHPSKEAFEKFLKSAGDVQYRRAVDLESDVEAYIAGTWRREKVGA
jgi:hypothetical protein